MSSGDNYLNETTRIAHVILTGLSEIRQRDFEDVIRMWEVRSASNYSAPLLFFFFQAEDGIRDVAVTGVQTCALPIYDPRPERHSELHHGAPDQRHRRHLFDRLYRSALAGLAEGRFEQLPAQDQRRLGEIGRASCRERVSMPVGAGWLQTQRRSRSSGR